MSEDRILTAEEIINVWDGHTSQTVLWEQDAKSVKLERQAIAKTLRDKIMKSGSPELAWIRLRNMVDTMLRGERPE